MFSQLAGAAVRLIAQITMVLMLLSGVVWGARGPRPLSQDEDVFARGVQAYSAGDYSKAEKLLASYLKDNPNGLIRDIGMLWYGRSLLALNRVEDAQKLIQNMSKEFPNSPLTQKLRDESSSHAKNKVNGKSGKPELAKPLDAKTELEYLKQETARRKETLKASSKGTTAAPVLRETTAATPAETRRAKPQTSPVAVASASSKKPDAPSRAPLKITAKTNPTQQKESATHSSKPAAVVAAKVPTPMPSPLPAVKRPTSQQVQMAQNREKVSAPRVKQPISPEKSATRREMKTAEKSLATASKKSAAQSLKPAKASTVEVAKKKIEVGASERGTTQHSSRDPFRPLVMQSGDELPPNLPPGKKGLLIERLQLKGIVRNGEDFLAITQSGTDAAAIFLRVGDQLYDGEVQKIYDDRVVFKHVGMDKLGKSYLEEVTKRLTGTAIF